MTPDFDAKALMALLAQRHADAVFVDECKMGSSWNGAERLDGWALLKTWSPFTTIGYEVKVSRSDFLRDNKWQRYLPACHEFYFVCPKGLIQPEELPLEVGLLVTGGQRLVTKRKAVRREPDTKALSMLMAYALMSRARIVANWHEANRADNLDIWREWLTQKRESQAVGHAASARLKEIVSEHRQARVAAEHERDRLQNVKDTLAALGFDGDAAAWTVKHKAAREPLLAALAQVKRQVRQIDLTIDRELGAEHAQ